MRHINFVLVCVLGLLLSAPAFATTASDPVTKALQEEAEIAPYGSGGG